eukprot:1139852-Pelagomonas_calceolata.AAC.3
MSPLCCCNSCPACFWGCTAPAAAAAAAAGAPVAVVEMQAAVPAPLASPCEPRGLCAQWVVPSLLLLLQQLQRARAVQLAGLRGYPLGYYRYLHSCCSKAHAHWGDDTSGRWEEVSGPGEQRQEEHHCAASWGHGAGMGAIEVACTMLALGVALPGVTLRRWEAGVRQQLPPSPPMRPCCSAKPSWLLLPHSSMAG